jgi:hypothetical protein
VLLITGPEALMEFQKRFEVKMSAYRNTKKDRNRIKIMIPPIIKLRMKTSSFFIE